MNRTRTFLLSTLLVPALAAAVVPGDSLGYHPAVGSKLSRNWSIKQELTLDDMQMTMNGQPLPMDLQMNMNTSVLNEISVTDHIVSMREGAPKELVRTFDKLATNGDFSVEMAMMPDGGMENTVSGSSELQGKTVKFSWNADDGDYDVAFDESEGEASLLEHLDEDMDLRAVLPKGEVAEGDTWEVDVARLRPLLAPGGDVGIRPETMGDEDIGGMMPGMDNMGDLSEMLGEMLEGTASAEYKGVEEVEGVKLGVIQLTIDIESANDMADKVADMLQEMPEGIGSISIDHMDVEFGLKAKGTVKWNIAAGHIHSVDISGDVSTDVDTGMSIEAEGRSMNMEQTMSMRGTITIQLEVTEG